MTRGNPAFEPSLFPERAQELLDTVYQIPGVNQLYGEMRSHHQKTADHLESVALFTAALVLEGLDPDLEDRDFSSSIVLAALLHDIGKTHPDVMPLIDYPGWYSDTQRSIMKQHSRYGAEFTSMYSGIRGDGLVPDIIYLHHADSEQIEAYIAERGYDFDRAQQLRIGVTIVSIADVVEATLPIGEENSHATYGDRNVPFAIVQSDIHEPLRKSLPDIAIKDTVLTIAQRYAQSRVLQRELEPVYSFVS